MKLPWTKSNFKLNSRTGALTIEGFDILPNTRIEDLPSGFSVSEESAVMVLKKDVACTFARNTFTEGHLEATINIRFEEQILVSLFIHLADTTKDYSTGPAFWGSVKERKALHEKWLESKLGSYFASDFWKSIGVAQDRSDNVYIYFHSCNNSWI